MSGPLLNLVKRSLLLGCLLVLCYQVQGQDCCAPAGSCNTCSGGIHKLTLRYHGAFPALVKVTDNSDIIFNGFVAPGGTITLTGSFNGNFVANQINFYLGASIFPNAQIKTNCSLQLDPATYYGLFTIVSAESKNGGVMCCTSNSGATPPEITGCPANLAVNTTTACNGVATWTPPDAIDCDLVSLTSTHAPGSSFPIGATQVTYTARNGSGLTSTCTFTVTVSDKTKPVVTTTTPNVIVNAGSDCKATATWTAPVFSDNCGIASTTSTHASGSIFSLGTTTVTYTATDAAGNSASSQFTVTVKDATPPVVTNCPKDISVQTTTACTAVVTWAPPSFTDACNALIVGASIVPGSTFDAGSTTVTYTATDAAGNVTLCSFQVLVKEIAPPEFTSCPADTTLSTTTAGGVRYSWALPVVTDACSTPQLTATHHPGDNFPVGVSTVMYTATDVSGNKAQCSFVVTVKQEQTKLDITQLLTPDGNAVNDAWIIGNIELYKENKVTVIDRWGSVVYTETGYDNEQRAWRGRNTQGNLVPSGTYFFTISVRSGKDLSETRGFVEVIR